jgi:hypothetical protein
LLFARYCGLILFPLSQADNLPTYCGLIVHLLKGAGPDDCVYELSEEPDDFDLLLSALLLEPPESDEPELEVALLLSDPDTFFFLPDLKSVSYQPPPFKRKPAADIRFTKLSLLQFGQIFNGSSLSFCIASSSCPQLSQRYSYIGIFYYLKISRFR